MGWGAFIGSAVVAAVVSGIISVIGLVVSTRTARALHTDKLKFDKRMAERKFEFDKELAEREMRNADHDLHDHKRPGSTSSEQVLADFYKAGKIFEEARSPHTFAGEGTSRPHQQNETNSG